MNAITPLVLVICVLQLTVVKAPLHSFILFLAVPLWLLRG
jgi:hypothetical protein